MPQLRALLALLVLAAPRAAQSTAAFEREVGGAKAVLELVGPEPAGAAEAGFAALASAPGPGAGCDAALAALAAAGAPAAIVRWRGAAAAGEPPPGKPGWPVEVGFGTAGYPVMVLPLAGVGLGRSAAPEDPLRVQVVAASAAEAERLAHEARALGRRAGRALLAQTPGVLVFLEDPRFRPLFDGRTLAGWTPRGGRYDGDAVWSVERGAITGRTGPDGAGGLLYTEELFTSFELELEAFVDEPFDSGIFVRMVPDLKGAQVTLDNRPDGEIGGIYSDGWLLHSPGVRERYAQGRYNHFEVRVTGFDLRVEAWMNGEPVADYRLPPEAAGYAVAGRIGLQVHGGAPGEGRARFRSVRVRELPALGEELRAEDGWRPLFDGQSLEGWERHGVQEGYRVEDGVLLFPARGDGHLASAEDFEDFELRLDFRTLRMANSGVFLRAARDGSNPAFSGCEVQIIDDFNWHAGTGQELKPWQLTGSLYGAVPAGPSGLLEIGQWNTLELRYRGPRLGVALNGRLLYDVDTHALAPESGTPFAERAARGFIGLQAHSPEGLAQDGAISFRDVRVRRL